MHGMLISNYVASMRRERYRKAADMSRVNGKLSCLLINDLDAGIARFGNTQVGLGAWTPLHRAAGL